MRIGIKSNGTPAGTNLVNLDTGETISNCEALHIEIDARAEEFVKCQIRLTLMGDGCLDIIAPKAEIATS